MNIPNYIQKSSERYNSSHEQIEKNRIAIDTGTSPIEVEDDKQLIKKRLIRLGSNPDIARERMIGNNDLVHIIFLKKLQDISKTVGRITVMNDMGTPKSFGTGFMVGKGLLLTNNHVLPSREDARNAFIDFNYELSNDGTIAAYHRFKINPEGLFITSDASNGLDYTLIEVLPQATNRSTKLLEDFGWNQLFPEKGKAIKGEAMIVVQHPEGDVKKVAFRNNNLLYYFDHFLQYETDTLQGSSGGLVANISLEIVALHHSSVPKMNDDQQILTKDGSVFSPSVHTDTDIHWIANEGVRVSSIWNDIFSRTNLTDDHNKKRELLKGRAYYPYTIDEDNEIEEIKPVLIDPYKAPPENNPPNHSTSLEDSNQNAWVILLTVEDSALGESALKFISKKYDVIPKPTFGEKKDLPKVISGMYFFECKFSHPWVLCQELEIIPGVVEAVPELPEKTNVDINLDLTLDKIDGHKRSEIKLESYHALKYRESFGRNGGSNEEAMLQNYKLRYGKYPNVKLVRNWNYLSSAFDKANLYFDASQNGATVPMIAMLDTGYTYHPEIEDIHKTLGKDFVDTDNDANDEMVDGLLRQPMHGTRTASIIIGRTTENSMDGNDGVFKNAKVVPFRISNSVILLNRFRQVAEAVNYAIKNKFEVLSMSMGILPGHKQWRALAKYAYDSGAIWVCAAGNKVNSVVVPAKYPGTICVAASNVADQPWKGSCFGKQVDITAPGEDVYVPIFDQDDKPSYAYGSGTSYATPHVAAAASMWLSYHKKTLENKYTYPWQKVEAFRYCLKKSARQPKDLISETGQSTPQTWNNSNFGPGLLNAEALLQQNLPEPEQLIYAYTIDQNESLYAKENIIVKELLYNQYNSNRLRASRASENMIDSNKVPLSPHAEAYLAGINDLSSPFERNFPEVDLSQFINETEFQY